LKPPIRKYGGLCEMPWPAWDFTGLGAVGADVDSP